MTSSKESHLLFHQHLGYQLRATWISKALLALLEAEHLEAEDPGAMARIFAFPNASDRFGLGPTMIQAMRFWLRATGLITIQRQQSARPVPTLTAWGRLLAQADPYLTRAGSLWMLHAHLARNWSDAPAFAWFFQQYALRSQPFTQEGCLARLQTWAIAQAPTQEIRLRALRNDLACLLRMYLPGQPGSPEQELSASPFRGLELLAPLPPTDAPVSYHLLAGHPPALIVLALLLLEQQALLQGQEAQPQLVRDLVSRPGGVGRTFGMTASELVASFARIRLMVPSWSPCIQCTRHLEWVTLPAIPPEAVIEHYYRCADER